MKALINEFKTFIMKGNVVDLAVGVIIGGAFGKIVESMVKDIITPIIGLVGGQPDFSGIALFAHKAVDPKTHAVLMKDGKEILEGGIMIGNFINALVGFLIIAAVVFFGIIKPLNKLQQIAKKKEDEKPAEPAPVPADVVLLTEIRDLLKK
jgi:large conductance mechanosensitive channel